MHNLLIVVTVGALDVMALFEAALLMSDHACHKLVIWQRQPLIVGAINIVRRTPILSVECLCIAIVDLIDLT